jgi:hypothetical protein
MKRFHIHVSVDDLAKGIRTTVPAKSEPEATRPGCCA